MELISVIALINIYYCKQKQTYMNFGKTGTLMIDNMLYSGTQEQLRLSTPYSQDQESHQVSDL